MTQTFLLGVLETLIVILCVLDVSIFFVMIFWDSARRILLLSMVMINFVLTPLLVADHSWVFASITALCAILLFIYLATEEVIKRLKP